MTREVTLNVGGAPIPLDYFVERFVDHTVVGMIAALEGTGEIGTLDLTIDGDAVAVTLNDAPLPVNAFVSKIIGSTVRGMVSVLKGVSDTTRIKILVRR
ncbi:MAG: hypothetical protein ABID87_06165 [Chloroflexota bacterium]